MVQKVIEFVCPHGKGVDHLETVRRLLVPRDLTDFVEVHHRVDKHLRMDAQILQIALRNHGADDVGQTADTELEAGPVFDLRHDILGDLDVHLRALGGGELYHRRIMTLYDIINP